MVSVTDENFETEHIRCYRLQTKTLRMQTDNSRLILMESTRIRPLCWSSALLLIVSTCRPPLRNDSLSAARLCSCLYFFPQVLLLCSCNLNFPQLKGPHHQHLSRLLTCYFSFSISTPSLPLWSLVVSLFSGFIDVLMSALLVHGVCFV